MWRCGPASASTMRCAARLAFSRASRRPYVNATGDSPGPWSWPVFEYMLATPPSGRLSTYVVCWVRNCATNARSVGRRFAMEWMLWFRGCVPYPLTASILAKAYPGWESANAWIVLDMTSGPDPSTAKVVGPRSRAKSSLCCLHNAVAVVRRVSWVMPSGRTPLAFFRASNLCMVRRFVRRGGCPALASSSQNQ
eukprot:958863-Karenia_brevis.AAC.1